MSSRGFTLVELAIVLAIFSILTPLTFMASRVLLENYRRAAFDLEVAQAARTVSEELRLDARAMRLQSFEQVVFKGPGKCDEATWSVTAAHALIRTPKAGCGEQRAVAKSVSKVTARSGGVLITFSLPLRAELSHDVPLFVGVPR